MVAELKVDLLDRIVLIQKSITGVIDAVPRLFDPPSATGPFPRFVNGLERAGFEREVGAGYVRERVRVTMRLITGAYGAGYVGEREDSANQLYDTVIETFFARTALQDPVTKAAFQYLEAGEGASIGEVIYARPLQAADGNLFLCADFTLNVVLFYPVRRVMGS